MTNETGTGVRDPGAASRSTDETDTHASEDTGPQAIDPPHVDGYPIVGSTISVVRDSLAFGSRVLERGDVVSYDAFGEHFIAVADPNLVEEILVSRSDEFRKGDWETEFGQVVAPSGLAFTEGEQWRRQRLALQGSFTPGKVRSFGDAIVDRASALADDWARAPAVQLRDEAARFTLDVLTRTLLDVDLDAERGQIVADVVDGIGDYISPLSLAAPEWLPLPAERRYRRAMSELDDLVDALIVERRAAMDAGDGGGHRDDLLGTMLAAVETDEGGIRRDELRDQITTFLVAGHETTATALTYVIWLLADAPRVRERLDAELETVLDGSTPGFEDVPQLEYTQAVIEEALRLYPPVFAIYREPIEETTIGRYRVAPGDTLQLSTYHVHRDQRWWDDPTAFRPARWLDETERHGTAARPEYAYVPFGGGPRHCIGMRFARLELQLALATLASELTFDQVGGIDPAAKLTLDPGDVRIQARPRE